MSSRKTIKINPELFKLGSSSSKKRDKKTKKERPIINIKPNKVKKELLNKIKEYQKHNEEKNKDHEEKSHERENKENNYVNQVLKPNRNHEKDNKREYNKRESNKSNINIDTNDCVSEFTDNNEFNNEFNKSLQFLQELSREKKEKLERKKKKKTLKKQRAEIGQVNLDLPNELQNNLVLPVSQIDINIPTTLPNLVTNIPSFSNYPKYSNNFEEKIEKDNKIDYDLEKLSEDVPYGCLKKGNKPTFREWKRETQKKSICKVIPQELNVLDIPEVPIQIPATSSPPLDEVNKIQDNSERYKERIERLEQLKEEFKEKSNSQDIHKAKKSGNKTLTLVGKNTRVTKYKLGKKGRLVSVLIKNNETRKNIREDLSALRKTSLLDIKNYLRKHNLIKAGCDAPNDIIRQIFEQAVLSGEITNLNKDNLLHNYFHE